MMSLKGGLTAVGGNVGAIVAFPQDKRGTNDGKGKRLVGICKRKASHHPQSEGIRERCERRNFFEY
jgi:hypothetical protein